MSPAKAGIEYLDYVDTTGYEWVDTGIVPNRPTVELYADFAILEKPSSRTPLFGACHLKDNAVGWEDSNGASGWNWITSLAFYVGSDMNAMWCGGNALGAGGYAFNYDARVRYLIRGYLATVWRNGSKAGGGYYDVPGGPNGYHITGNAKNQYTAGQTIYVGNLNNAGEGAFVAEGSMPRTRWYGFRIVDGGTTLCDLVPAKDGDRVGFYDRVSGNLLTSSGSKDFLEPERFVWKGGGDTAAWTDGSNWEGGVAPEEGIAVIPDNCKAVATTADVATMNKCGKILLIGDNSVLSFSNMTGTATLTTSVKGKGLLLVEQAANTGDQRNLRIDSDNSEFDGDFRAEKAGLSIGHAHAFGNGTVTIGMAGSQRWEICVNGVITNDLYVKGGAMVIPGSQHKPELSGDFHVMGDLTIRGYNINYPLTLSGRLIRETGAYFALGDAIVFKCRDLDFSAFNDTVWAGGGTKWIGGNVISWGRTAYAEGTWKFITENALGPKTGGEIRLGTNNRIFTADLQGLDQRWGTMFWMAGTESAPSFVITSTQGPAMLTILGGIRNDSLPDTYCGRVNGEASIMLNSTNSATAATAKFAFGKSETTGGFTAQRGTIELQNTTTFSNLTHLVATETGLIRVATPDVGNATNLLVSVTNATSARIEIAADVTLEADTAFLDDRWLGPGDYSSAASTGVRACPSLAGTGILHVRRYGGRPGFLLFLR